VASALRRPRVERREKLKALEAENVKLKRLLAERDLEIDAMKEVVRRKW
jgi:putative transposase